MGTIRSANKSVLRLFNGSWNDKVLDQPMDPITRQSDFRVKGCLKEKTKLPRSSHLHCRIPLRYSTLSTSWLVNINPTPFEDTRQSLRVRKHPCLLTNPCPTAVKTRYCFSAAKHAGAHTHMPSTKKRFRSCYLLQGVCPT